MRIPEPFFDGTVHIYRLGTHDIVGRTERQALETMQRIQAGTFESMQVRTYGREEYVLRAQQPDKSKQSARRIAPRPGTDR